MTLIAINPADGRIIGTYPGTAPEEADRIIVNSWEAQRSWNDVGFARRAALLKKVARVLRQNRSEYGRLMAVEMGKPIQQGRAEIEKCAWGCEYFGDHAEEMLRPEMVSSDARKSYVCFQPLGVILAVMPWNYPFWQVFRCAAPALMAGNSLVLKHASNVPGCALAIERIMNEAGLPENLFKVLLIPGGETGGLVGHPLIRGISLTGSVDAGRAVAAAAGRFLKKTVLELGGSDPYIILEDADLGPTVETCVAGRLLNSGQSCIAAKRFIVVEAVKQRFEAAFVERMNRIRTGDPLDEAVEVGPLARIDLRETLHRQVRRSVEQGALCLLGGELPPGKGAYYPPTVLTNVRKGMPAFDEETFGPVAAVVSARDETEAIRLANDSPYGLGAAVFTADVERGERIARNALEAGNCFINAYVRSDPRLPFGGIKESGYGRELSAYGIREFVNIKTVYLA